MVGICIGDYDGYLVVLFYVQSIGDVFIDNDLLFVCFEMISGVILYK